MKILKLFPLLLVVQFLVGCLTSTDFDSRVGLPGPGAAGDESFLETGVEVSNWYQVYFSAPDSPATGTLRGGPDEHLAQAIDLAHLSVDMAVDSLNLWSIRDALLDAHQRGVLVRLVIESDGLDSQEILDLQGAGIQVVDDRRNGLMHNKFAIIDRREVWTGSMNLTVSGAYRSDNNLVAIQSPELAEDYLVEFEEMFVDHQFGADSPANTPLPLVDVAGTQVEVYFSPDDATIERLIELVHQARHNIQFMAYSFTDDDLAAEMIEVHLAGIEVSGVMDESQGLSNTGGEYENLLANGIEVRLDGNPGSMHHKVIIIDEQVVVTGSYNFSKSAKTRNDENTLILHDPEIAALYQDEFERVWGLAGD